MRTASCVACVALVLGPAASSARTPAPTRPTSLRQWLDGPVHYLVTKDEIKEFNALRTDPDRAAFMERFWRRRDPTPATLVNEYRQLFWNRVLEVNAKFLDSPGPGWQTDRGKIYILYGPPDEISEDPNARVGTGTSDGAGIIRWTYLKPGGRRDVDPVVYVPFVRDGSGEYRLSYDPQLSSPFFSWSSIDDARSAGLSRFLAATSATSRDPVSVMLDLGRLQEVPPQEALLLDSVEVVETFAYQPLPIAIDRFQPGGPGFLAIVTVAIPGGSEVEPPAIIARFVRVGGATGAHILGEGSFRIDGDGDLRVAQARVRLDSEAWDVTVLAVEPRTGVGRMFRGRVEPLPGGSALHLSDVVLARALEPLSFAAQASYDAPYIIGGFRVTPLAGSVLPRGEAVQVFLEIYGGTAPYHLAYRLEGQEKDGLWRSLGKSQEHDTSASGQGFALQTSASWPAGAYRLRVLATDAAGATAERAVGWTLGAGEAVPQP